MHNKKFDIVQQYIEQKEYEGFIVFLDNNIRYLTGIQTNGCLFLGEDPFLLVPLLNYDLVSPHFENTITYFHQKVRNDTNLRVGSVYSVLKEQLKSRNVTKVFVDYISPVKAKLLDINYKNSEKIEKMRMIKDSNEISLIKKATEITNEILDNIEFSQKTDRELIAELVHKARIKADDISYNPIATSGKNTRYPHPNIIDKRLSEDPVLLDFGVKHKGYCADITQTYSKKHKPILEFLDNLILEVLDEINIGMKFYEIDEIVRKKLKRRNYDSNLIHLAGHGVGLEVHERPNMHNESKDSVENGTVFALEPGIYFEDFGLRIEKMIAIQNGKSQIL